MASFLTLAFRRGATSSNATANDPPPANQEDEMQILIKRIADSNSREIVAKKMDLMKPITKNIEKVVKLCSGQGINLKNSPPFILDILPEMQALLTTITSSTYRSENIQYLTVFMENLNQKCEETIKLFKGSNILNPESNERRKLTKMSLTFSHQLFELKALYSAAEGFIGDSFRITKKEPEHFWKTFFNTQIFVSWANFLDAISREFRRVEGLEANTLKKTVDLTKNGYVSIFEFDVFTRLFCPWKTLLNNWQLLTTTHPGYMAFMTYDDVKKKLQLLSNRPGSYVFRLSCTRPGQWAIGYVAPDGKIYQTIPQNKSLLQALQEGAREGFYIYPNGREINVDLSGFVKLPDFEILRVTQAEYEEYSAIGSTFEQCKICDDNDKDRILEPCGHMLCLGCLTKWQDTEGGTKCPYCRCEIKGTNKVVIEKYVPPKTEKENGKDAPLPPLPAARQRLPPPLPPRNSCNKMDHMEHTYVNLVSPADTPESPPETMAPLPPTEPSSRAEINYMNLVQPNE